MTEAELALLAAIRKAHAYGISYSDEVNKPLASEAAVVLHFKRRYEARAVLEAYGQLRRERDAAP